MKKKNLYGEWFCGNKISEYGLERGYLDYGTLAKAFDAVLCNDIMSKTWELGEWETLQGFDEEDGEMADIFQLYIIDANGADIIETYTNDPLFYHYELNLYVWGVTHYGTSWDYVLTDVKCNTKEW